MADPATRKSALIARYGSLRKAEAAIPCSGNALTKAINDGVTSQPMLLKAFRDLGIQLGSCEPFSRPQQVTHPWKGFDGYSHRQRALKFGTAPPADPPRVSGRRRG